MTKDQKEAVKKHFLQDKSFEGACRLYSTLPGRNLMFVRRMNTGNNSGLLDHIHYDMAKLAGIPETVMNNMLATPAAAPKVKEAKAPASASAGSDSTIAEFDPETITEDQVLLIDMDNTPYHLLMALAVHLNLELPNRKKATVIDAVIKFQEHLKAKKAVVGIPEKVLEAMRLRDEFPFLKDKNCPNELKILVADRITAHETYVKAHAELFESHTEEVLAEIAKTVVVNYLENRLIWEELNFYKENDKPLGKHPIWRTSKLVEEIQSLEVKDLIKKRNSFNSSKSIAGKNIEKELKKESPDEAKITAWKETIAEKVWLMELADNRINGLGK